jgi:hypothetical protein
MRCGAPLLSPAGTDQKRELSTSSTQQLPQGSVKESPLSSGVNQKAPLTHDGSPAHSVPSFDVSPTADTARSILVAGKKQVSAVNIWGPFAGYGTQHRHVGWLMDRKGDRQGTLIQKVSDIFIEREIPGAVIQQVTLTERGVLVEKRRYFIIKRGLVSLALYITRFGQDLFISLASYLKPPISNFRILVVGLMLLFWAFMTLAFPAILDARLQNLIYGLNPLGGGGSSTDIGGLVGMLCILSPLGLLNSLALFLLLVYSIYKWITEKDFWAGLRVSPNEFHENDLMAMEKAVEQTVRISLDELGLDPADLQLIESRSPKRII